MSNVDNMADAHEVMPDGLSQDLLSMGRALSETLQIGVVDEVVVFDQNLVGFAGVVNIQFLTAIGTRKNVQVTFDYASALAFDGRIPEKNALVVIGFLPADGVSGQDRPIVIGYLPPDWNGKLREAQGGAEGGAGGYGNLINDGIDVAGVVGKVKLQPGEYAHVRKDRVTKEFSYWIMRNGGDIFVQVIKDIVHECVREIITADEVNIDAPDIKLGTKVVSDVPAATAVLLKDFITQSFFPQQHIGNMGVPTGPTIDQTIKPGTFADGVRAKP